MHRSSAAGFTAPRHHHHAARHALLAGLTCAVAGAALAPSAQALVVTTGPEGLVMREPNNTLNRITLSLVESGGVTRYRVEMPEFGGRGASGGPGCTTEEPRRGVNVVTCDRISPRVSVSLGPLDDTFAVDPSFPDPIDAFGGIGADRFTLGAGNDTLRPSSGGGGVDGGAGDDVLNGGSDGGALFGGEGNDQLSARQGTSIDGGPGDDILTLDGDGVDLVRGGEGLDTFTGPGSARVVDSRDGVAEQVFCGRFANTFESKFSLRFSRAIVDLVDTPDDAGLFAAGCANVDRAPRGEAHTVALPGTSVRLRGGRAEVKVRCAAKARCSGTVTVALGARTGTAKYRISGGKTKTVRVKVGGKAATARVSISEQGVKGLRTIDAGLRVKR